MAGLRGKADVFHADDHFFRMTTQPYKLPEEKLREKLEAFPPGFREHVWTYRRAPAPEGLEAIARGLLAYHAGAAFQTKYAEKKDDLRLVEDLGFDSLALVDLSFQAEEFVGIVIQMEDLPKIKTLRDLLGLLRSKAFPNPAFAG